MDILKQTNYKRLVVIVLVMLAGPVLIGCQGSNIVPQFTYQGVLTDGSGHPLNGSATITYRIYDDDNTGTALYSQTETVTVTDGRFDSAIGPSLGLAGLDPEDLTKALFLELEIDDGTYVEILTPRQRLYGSPYAFTLMPGTVIASSMASMLKDYNINAVVSVVNKETSDPIPALRVQGQQGIELVSITGTQGTIYSDMDDPTSDLSLHSNDDIYLYLDRDNTELGAFIVSGVPATNYCSITDQGNIYCTGSKSSIVAVADEQRALYAVESPGVWFEDFGSSSLESGVASVQIDPMFAQSVNLDVEYHVFLTPLGECNGLYVINKTGTGFEVRELGGGTSNVSFDYRIVAKRAGYEDLRMEIAPASESEIGQ